MNRICYKVNLGWMNFWKSNQSCESITKKYFEILAKLLISLLSVILMNICFKELGKNMICNIIGLVHKFVVHPLAVLIQKTPFGFIKWKVIKAATNLWPNSISLIFYVIVKMVWHVKIASRKLGEMHARTPRFPRILNELPFQDMLHKLGYYLNNTWKIKPNIKYERFLYAE